MKFCFEVQFLTCYLTLKTTIMNKLVFIPSAILDTVRNEAKMNGMKIDRYRGNHFFIICPLNSKKPNVLINRYQLKETNF